MRKNSKELARLDSQEDDLEDDEDEGEQAEDEGGEGDDDEEEEATPENKQKLQVGNSVQGELGSPSDKDPLYAEPS